MIEDGLKEVQTRKTERKGETMVTVSLRGDLYLQGLSFKGKILASPEIDSHCD